MVNKNTEKKIKSILKPQCLFTKMCLLMKDQGQKRLITWCSRSRQASEPQNLTLQFIDPGGSWKIPDVRVDPTFRSLFLLRTFRYYLGPHLAMSAPHRHSPAISGSDHPLFLLLVVSFTQGGGTEGGVFPQVLSCGAQRRRGSEPHPEHSRLSKLLEENRWIKLVGMLRKTSRGKFPEVW